MFIHGGWWRSLEPAMFSQMAAGPNARGVTVAVAGYDLCPQVSIATIIEQMRAACLLLWRKHAKRIFVYGHSAGGHLAACMLAQDWKAFRIRRAGRSGAGRLTRSPACSIWRRWCTFRRTRICGSTRRKRGGCRRCTGRSPPGARSTPWWARSNRASSCARARKSSPRLGARGVETRYEEIAGANHFTVVDPLSDPDSAMTRRVADLAMRVNAMAL